MNVISQAIAAAAIVGLIASITSGLISDASAATPAAETKQKELVLPANNGDCQFGIKFVPGAYLNGYNEKKLTRQTMTSCLQACDNEPWCKSIDLDAANGICYLAKVTRDDVSSGLFRDDDSLFDYYEQCQAK